jgi:hypothetical protein
VILRIEVGEPEALGALGMPDQVDDAVRADAIRRAEGHAHRRAHVAPINLLNQSFGSLPDHGDRGAVLAVSSR